MVHINRVSTDREIESLKAQYENIDTIPITEEEEQDDYTATVYGSKYAGEDLPRHEMPEREMPAAVAHRMIKDDLTLDGTPTLNLASFVTTYMEKEAEDLMVYAVVIYAWRIAFLNLFVVTPFLRTSSITRNTPLAQTFKTVCVCGCVWLGDGLTKNAQDAFP